GLRWLLRYGAVPRRLTFSFVQEVLHPLLIRALKGETETTEEDIPKGIERQTWLRNANEQLDPTGLWKKLSKYSSEHSWISLDDNDPNTATLHTDVVRPMRRLLKDQKVYRQLNFDAANHFAKLKKEQPTRWLDFTLGELYHRMYLGED